MLFYVQGTKNTVNTDVAGASPARVYVPLEPQTIEEANGRILNVEGLAGNPKP